MPKLIITEHGKKGEKTHSCLENDISIGRSEDNKIVLTSPSISREHAKIIRTQNDFFLMDLGSQSGTSLNGMPVRSEEKHLLRTNDLITIGDFELRFYAADDKLISSYNEEITDSDVLEVKLLKKVIKAIDKETVPSLEVLNGSQEGNKIFFADDMSELVIGRDSSCTFSINEFVISRRHARITKRWGGIVIRDMESKNGTFVNNRRIVEEFLHDGDRIALGTIVFMFRNPQEINLAEIAPIPPKRTPAPVKPDEIPLAKEEPLPEKPQGEEEVPQALENWDEEMEMPQRLAYPLHPPKLPLLKRLTPIEIGLVGLASLVLIFALITVANLVFE